MNWFQFFDVSVLIQFNFSFKKETEMEDGRNELLQLISVEIIFYIHGWVMLIFFVGI